MPVATKQTTKPAAKKPKTGSVLDRIGEMEFDDGIKTLLYGKTGTGKTTLWGDFPGKTLVVLCSNSKQPGELRSLFTPEHCKRIKPVVLESAEEITVLAQNAVELGFDNFVLDHITGFQDLVLMELLGLDSIPEQRSWGMASQQDYGTLANKCKVMLRYVLDLPINVIIVGQERETEPKENSELSLLPNVGVALTPSLAGWLYTSVDYICQTYIRQVSESKKINVGGKEKLVTRISPNKVQYCLRVGPHSVYTTKFRVPRGHKLPDDGVIVDPDYAKLIKVIQQGA